MILLVLALLMIGLATLWPMPGTPQPVSLCLLCGSRGTADFLLNIALFIPLGAALILRGRSRGSVVLFGLLLSAAIETSQFYIPGRDPSIGDVISNTLGTYCGSLLAQYASGWLFPQTAAASRLCRGAATAAALICLATGLLLAPLVPRDRYYGLWTPRLGAFEHYGGHILDARVDDVPITPDLLPERVREVLASDNYELRIRALAGPPPAGLAPLVAIFDDGHREVLLVGIDRDQLVYRSWNRAAALRFDRPEFRVRTVHHITGDTLAIAVRARDARPSVGIGWALLEYPESFPCKIILNAVWIGALFAPAGFWWRTRKDGAVVALGLVSGLLLAPLLTALSATLAVEWLGAGVGLAVGGGAAKLLRC